MPLCDSHDPATHTGVVAGPPGPSPRVPILTVLHHPDLRRVGERAVLAGLPDDGELLLSRNEPRFSIPGEASGDGRPLDHTCLSRRPVRVRRKGFGALSLDATGCPTPVVAHGQPLAVRTFSAGELDDGVILVLGRGVTLLLHLVEPATPPDPPCFGLIGESQAVVDLRHEIRKVADLDVSVMLRGETGSGKELVAQAIHRASPRHAGPFVAIDLASLPATLATAELFGAVRGAYTGAHKHRPGLFVEVHGGTLFLDEVGEAQPEVQALLLRTLETREVRPVGGGEPRPVDVRVISATDANLEAVQGALASQAPTTLAWPSSLRARRVGLAGDFGGEGIIAQGVVVVGILVAQGDGEDPLPEQVLGRMVDPLGVSEVDQAIGR